jgi:hypothetical protein
VDLDPVRTGFPRPTGPVGEAADELLNLLGRHPLALESVDRLGLVRRAPALLELDAADVALSAGEGELDDIPAAVLVDAAHELAPEGDRLVAVDVRVVGDDQAPRVDRRVRGDDRAHSAARELEIPVHVRRGAHAVVVVEATRKAGAKDPVLHLERAEPQGLEDHGRIGQTASS